MAPGSSVGTASMLRARRKDVNVKPNRRLDRKSSRGMLYENEELRLRTININAEVERGQNDIKKLRRENEQLRREIWGLRDEYDRLEGLLGKLNRSPGSQDEDDEETAETNEYIVEEEEGRNTMVENEENLQKAASSIKSQSHRNSLKVDFDGLSVVDEETDDNQVGSVDSANVESNVIDEHNMLRESYYRSHPQDANYCDGAGQVCDLDTKGLVANNNNGAGMSYSNIQNGRTSVVFTPFTDVQVVPHRKEGMYSQSRDYPIVLELQRSSTWGSSLYNKDDLSDNHADICYTSAHFPNKHFFSSVQSVEQMNRANTALLSMEGGDPIVSNRKTNRIGYAYSCLDSGKTVSAIPNENMFNEACLISKPVYGVENPSPSVEQTLPECFHLRGGPDFFISGAYPQERCRPKFPMGGNLDQLLQEVHGRSGNKVNIKTVNIMEPKPSFSIESNLEQHQDSPHKTRIAKHSEPQLDREISDLMHSNSGMSERQSEQNPHIQKPPAKGEGQSTSSKTQLGPDGGAVALLLSQFGTMIVGGDQKESTTNTDRFRSQLSIKLRIPDDLANDKSTNLPSPEQSKNNDAIQLPDTFPSNVPVTNSGVYRFNTSTQTSPKIIGQDIDDCKICFPEFSNNELLFRRNVCANPFERGYQSFIASNPELSNTKTRLISNSMQNLKYTFNTGNILTQEQSLPLISSDWNNQNNISQNVAQLSSESPKSCFSLAPKNHYLYVHNLPLPGSTGDLSNSVQTSGTEQVLNKNHDSITNNTLPVINMCLSKDPSRDLPSQSSTFSCNASQSKNKLFLPISQPSASKVSETHSSDYHQEATYSIPPSPAGTIRNSPLRSASKKVGSILQLHGEDLTDGNSSTSPTTSHKQDRARKIGINHLNNIDTFRGDNANEISSPESQRKSFIHRGPLHRKMSVIVGDTQQGRNMMDYSRSSSSGQDSPTKSDRRRRVSVYFNNKRRIGIGGRRETGGALKSSHSVNNGMLTRSVSLDPTRCRLASPSVEGVEFASICHERERTNSVSSKTSSAAGGGSVGRRKISRGSARGMDTSVHERSVPWCGCWGNGCI